MVFSIPKIFSTAVVALSIPHSLARFEEFHARVTDATLPIAACSDLGVAVLNDCTDFCTEINEDYDFFRDVNRETRCFCSATEVCSDRPTCEQLLIGPGNAATACPAYCTSSRVATFKDEIQLAGGTANANKNQTHNIVSCSCDGVPACDDFLLFSDLSFLKDCETELGIFSASNCEAHCVENAFTQRSRWEGESCFCQTTDGEATACQKAPSGTNAGVNSGKDGNASSSMDDGVVSYRTLRYLWVGAFTLVLWL